MKKTDLANVWRAVRDSCDDIYVLYWTFSVNVYYRTVPCPAHGGVGLVRLCTVTS